MDEGDLDNNPLHPLALEGGGAVLLGSLKRIRPALRGLPKRSGAMGRCAGSKDVVGGGVLFANAEGCGEKDPKRDESCVHCTKSHKLMAADTNELKIILSHRLTKIKDRLFSRTPLCFRTAATLACLFGPSPHFFLRPQPHGLRRCSLRFFCEEM